MTSLKESTNSLIDLKLPPYDYNCLMKTVCIFLWMKLCWKFCSFFFSIVLFKWSARTFCSTTLLVLSVVSWSLARTRATWSLQSLMQLTIVLQFSEFLFLISEMTSSRTSLGVSSSSVIKIFSIGSLGNCSFFKAIYLNLTLSKNLRMMPSYSDLEYSLLATCSGMQKNEKHWVPIMQSYLTDQAKSSKTSIFQETLT